METKTPAPFTRSLLRSVLVAIVLLLGVWGAVAAGAPDGDITPPVLVEASADRLSIDTSEAAQTITFTLRITDDLSGVAGAHLGFRHEHGYNTGRECQNWPQTSERDVTLECAVSWPQYSAEGRWMVTWFVLTDQVGNSGDGNVATCQQHESGRCIQYEYNELATPAIRSMEVWIEAANPDADPPLWLPLIMA